MDTPERTAETADRIIRHHFGCGADEIREVGHRTNNLVCSFTAAGGRYFLKLFRSRDWPEDGKIPFVYQCLARHGIPHAELIAYSRDDAIRPGGYLIERRVEGTSADRVQMDREQEAGFYAGLAELVSDLHRIGITNYGYIGSGIACYDRIDDFFRDEWERLEDELKDTLPEAQIETLKGRFFGVMRGFEDLPPVLCHGDLSRKNVIIGDHGGNTLIDWDDAIALNWMADVSRLTFRMRLDESEQAYSLFRSSFLEHYRASSGRAGFDLFESAYHIYLALDFLIFARKVGDRETERRLKGWLGGMAEVQAE